MAIDKKKIINLDECVLNALDLFCKQKVPRLDINFKKPLVVGSGNALATGRILFHDKEAVFANESNFKEKLKNVRNLFVEYHGNLDESKKLTELLLLFNETGFNYYVTEAGHIHTSVFKQRDRRGYKFDQQLNIFCFRD